MTELSRWSGVTYRLTAIGVVGAVLVVLLALLLLRSSGASPPMDHSGTNPGGDTGNVPYELTGNSVVFKHRVVRFRAAIISNNAVYLIYTMQIDGKDSMMSQSSTPEFTVIAKNSAIKTEVGRPLRLFRNVEVGAITWPVQPAQDEYRVGFGAAMGTSSQSDAAPIVLKQTHPDPSAMIALNSNAGLDQVRYRTEIGREEAVGPDVAAFSIDLVDSHDGTTDRGAFLIDQSGQLKVIDQDQLGELVRQGYEKGRQIEEQIEESSGAGTSSRSQ